MEAKIDEKSINKLIHEDEKQTNESQEDHTYPAASVNPEEDIKNIEILCPQCPKLFKCDRNLKLHIKLSHNHHSKAKANTKKNNYKYGCPECNMQLATRKGLVCHLARHTGYKPFQCPSCPKTFVDNSHLNEHMAIHDNTRRLKCTVPGCNKTFRSFQYRNFHILKHPENNPELKHQCNVCGKGFFKKTYLKNHMYSHSDKRNFQCSECGKTFKLRSTMLYHMKLHNSARPYECSTCHKTFRVPCDLRTHERIHTGEKPYMCAECGTCFITNSMLTKHIGIHHNKNRPSYCCEKCGKKYLFKKSLHDHLKIHEGTWYICSEDGCGKRFASERSYKSHGRVYHSSGKAKFVCEKCSKPCYGRQQYDHHMRNHTGIKPYQCTEPDCEKEFGTKTGLRRHLVIHTGAKPYVCGKCDKSFTFVSHYNHHRRKHYTNVKYLCLKCDHSNSHINSAKKHVLQAHLGIQWQRRIFRSADISIQNEINNSIKKVVEITDPEAMLCDQAKQKSTDENIMILDVNQPNYTNAKESSSPEAEAEAEAEAEFLDPNFPTFDGSEIFLESQNEDPVSNYNIVDINSLSQVNRNQLYIIEHQLLDHPSTEPARIVPQIVSLDLCEEIQFVKEEIISCEGEQATEVQLDFFDKEGHACDAKADMLRSEINQIMATIATNDGMLKGSETNQNMMTIKGVNGIPLESESKQNLLTMAADPISLSNHLAYDLVTDYGEDFCDGPNGDLSVGPEPETNAKNIPDSPVKNEIIHIEHPTRGTIEVTKFYNLGPDEQDEDNVEEKVSMTLKEGFDLEEPGNQDIHRITKIRIRNDDEFLSIIKKMNTSQEQIKYFRRSGVGSSTGSGPFFEQVSVSNIQDNLNTTKIEEKLEDKHVNTYLCEDCGQSFKRLKNLRYHMTNHAEEETLTCSKCGTVFEDYSTLKLHRSTHYVRDKICDICGKGFMYPSDLEDHRRTHTGEKPFVCSLCGHKLSRKAALMKHIRMHEIMDNKKGVLFSCGSCGKDFKTRALAKRHIKVHEKHPQEEVYVTCNLPGCGKRVKKKSFHSHKMTHLAERPYKCQLCPKSFALNCKLKEHMMKHNGIKPYKCTIAECGAQLGTPTGLKRHMVLHSGKRDFKCSICDKTFAFIGHLNAHMSLHTGEKKYVCNNCGKGFTRSGGLKRHLYKLKNKCLPPEQPDPLAIASLGLVQLGVQ